MTPLLWTLIAVQSWMGVFDTFYHHELTERLAWRPSQRHELRLHGVRNVLYAFLFLVLGWLEVHGIFAVNVMAVLVAEIVITLMDFVEEDISRKLPASERINHTLLANQKLWRHPDAAVAHLGRLGDAADRDRNRLHGPRQHRGRGRRAVARRFAGCGILRPQGAWRA